MKVKFSPGGGQAPPFIRRTGTDRGPTHGRPDAAHTLGFSSHSSTSLAVIALGFSTVRWWRRPTPGAPRLPVANENRPALIVCHAPTASMAFGRQQTHIMPDRLCADGDPADQGLRAYRRIVARRAWTRGAHYHRRKHAVEPVFPRRVIPRKRCRGRGSPSSASGRMDGMPCGKR